MKLLKLFHEGSKESSSRFWHLLYSLNKVLFCIFLSVSRLNKWMKFCYQLSLRLGWNIIVKENKWVTEILMNVVCILGKWKLWSFCAWFDAFAAVDAPCLHPRVEMWNKWQIFTCDAFLLLVTSGPDLDPNDRKTPKREVLGVVSMETDLMWIRLLFKIFLIKRQEEGESDFRQQQHKVLLL